MPKTKEYELSYCDMILEQAKKDSELDGVVDIATVFVSHAWKYKFLDVLDALKDHFKDEPDKIVWFDLVSNNQHKATDLPYEWWATTFKDAIKQMGHTIMIMAPWNDPIPYTRAWCIFEAYCTNSTGAKFEVAMSSKEKRSFIDECIDNPERTINQMLSVINAEKSKAFKVEDEERIHSVIADKVGFSSINAMVFEQLRDWVITVVMDELEKAEEDTVEALNLMNLAGCLYVGQGKYELAKSFFTDCLEKRTKVLGPDHLLTLKKTLDSMNDLALVYKKQKKYKEAEELLQESLKIRRKLFDSDQDTFINMNNLSLLYCELGKFTEAEDLYLEALEKQSISLGETHPSTLTTMNNIALFYSKQGNYEKAEELFIECLEKRKTVLGMENPSTFISLNNLASHYSKRRQNEKAEPLYSECLQRKISALGPDHPSTILSAKSLSRCYKKLGKLEHARKLEASLVPTSAQS
ncbi:hypothetical protein CTEN210_12443 [Chaetoceros tenuissimus]|uniref:Mbre TPR repeat protein n=1 Tax=Chaetoceros tenuissimus TaxID=426638 RepID=A0AAD3H9V0_9STRA|nr:hypothetical protein CTEN210_12443 [Chaetoceros tenuissimus]